MQILNIAGYKFIPLMDLSALKEHLLEVCNRLTIKGTILLSSEGININLAGILDSIIDFKTELKKDSRFVTISFKESMSEDIPFQQMKVKIKPEIITMRTDTVSPEQTSRAPSLEPEELKAWLDAGRDITLLDTRNDYEVRFGTFRNAINLRINDFSEFPKASETVSHAKPIVMFCTGGIRCEKAALHMLSQGYSDIYQLHGGILNYFEKVGGDHYDGECFVFDKRVALNARLETTGTQQCVQCEGPMKSNFCEICSKTIEEKA